MSSQCPFLPQDVAMDDDMDAWFCMLNSMVNFLSAASTLATKLEQNYLLSNVTTLRRPPFPLLCAPPQCQRSIDGLAKVQTPAKNDVKENSDIRSLLEERISAHPCLPESEYLGESNDLPQEVRYMNTQDKGDGASTNSQEEDSECNPVQQQVMLSAVSDVQDEDQLEETIKICDSEDTVYFDDFTDCERTVKCLNSQKPSDQVTQIHMIENVCQSSSIVQHDQVLPSASFFENKSVQAKCKNNDNLTNISKSKIKSIKTEEIQTNSTSRFKSTVRALITKSPELQQPIKDRIICHNQTASEKASIVCHNQAANEKSSKACHNLSASEKASEEAPIPKEKACCRHSSVPKNLNELKEQLDSIKNTSSSKVTVNEGKGGPQKSSKVLVDRTAFRKTKKLEKQPMDLPNANSYSSNVPLKSAGTSKRFASIESVVKKLIYSTRPVENKPDETKDIKKVCASLQRNIKKPPTEQGKHEGCKNYIAKLPSDHTEKTEHPAKDYKIVKYHQDFIYKKTVVQKSERPKSVNILNRPCSRKESPDTHNEVLTSRSQSQSRTTSLRSFKNCSTLDVLNKKEKDIKRAVSLNKHVSKKEDTSHDV